jgi:hypothetical protein
VVSRDFLEPLDGRGVDISAGGWRKQRYAAQTNH